MTGSLFIITAASGTGKTSLVKQLISSTNNLDVSISHTTRQPRSGEINGQHYHFISKEQFIEDINNNQFLEHAEVFGNYYGTATSSVKEQLNEGTDVILEIDWQGALQVKRQVQDAIMIFILPPNKDALKQRLSNRAQDSQDVIEQRLAGSVKEMQQYVNFDYLIINDDFDVALSELQAIIIANRQTLIRKQAQNLELINQLLAD